MVILAGLLAEREWHELQFPVDPSRSTDEWKVADMCQRWGIGREVYEDVLCKTRRLWASDWFHEQVA
jgi:hypothetical protein